MWEELLFTGKKVQYPAKPELYLRTAAKRLYNEKHAYLVGFWRNNQFAVVESAGNFKSAVNAQTKLNNYNEKVLHSRRYSVLYAK